MNTTVKYHKHLKLPAKNQKNLPEQANRESKTNSTVNKPTAKTTKTPII